MDSKTYRITFDRDRSFHMNSEWNEHITDEWYDESRSNEKRETWEYTVEARFARGFEMELDSSDAVIEWDKVD